MFWTNRLKEGLILFYFLKEAGNQNTCQALHTVFMFSSQRAQLQREDAELVMVRSLN